MLPGAQSLARAQSLDSEPTAETFEHVELCISLFSAASLAQWPTQDSCTSNGLATHVPPLSYRNTVTELPKDLLHLVFFAVEWASAALLCPVHRQRHAEA